MLESIGTWWDPAAPVTGHFTDHKDTGRRGQPWIIVLILCVTSFPDLSCIFGFHSHFCIPISQFHVIEFLYSNFPISSTNRFHKLSDRPPWRRPAHPLWYIPGRNLHWCWCEPDASTRQHQCPVPNIPTVSCGYTEQTWTNHINKPYQTIIYIYNYIHSWSVTNHSWLWLTNHSWVYSYMDAVELLVDSRLDRFCCDKVPDMAISQSIWIYNTSYKASHFNYTSISKNWIHRLIKHAFLFILALVQWSMQFLVVSLVKRSNTIGSGTKSLGQTPMQRCGVLIPAVDGIVTKVTMLKLTSQGWRNYSTRTCGLSAAIRTDLWLITVHSPCHSMKQQLSPKSEQIATFKRFN